HGFDDMAARIILHKRARPQPRPGRVSGIKIRGWRERMSNLVKSPCCSGPSVVLKRMQKRAFISWYTRHYSGLRRLRCERSDRSTPLARLLSYTKPGCDWRTSSRTLKTDIISWLLPLRLCAAFWWIMRGLVMPGAAAACRGRYPSRGV